MSTPARSVTPATPATPATPPSPVPPTAPDPSDSSPVSAGAAATRRGGLVAVPATRPVSVAVLADDPMTAESTAAYLGTRREVAVLPAARAADAEAVLLVTDAVSEATLDRAEELAAGRPLPRPRLVVLAATMREQHLWRAVALGLASVVPRAGASWDRVVSAVVASRTGRGELPPVALGWLLDQVRTLQQDVLAPAGLTPAGLTTREVDVLRLLAEGLDTVEIADALSYSERTIKNVIHGMISRLHLRNRSHAVAYALRVGAL